VVSRDGTVVYKAHVAELEACFSPLEYASLGEKFPHKLEAIRAHAARMGNRFFVDFTFDGVDRAFGSDLLHLMNDRACRSHFSPAAAETLTNYIHWYDENHPGVGLLVDAGKRLRGMSYLDLNGSPIKITFDRE